MLRYWTGRSECGAGSVRPLLCALASLLTFAAPARACTVCVDPPDKTTIDHLVVARDVVLAREDPARPFRFAPVEVLRGSAGGPAIPLLVNTALRRRLAVEPDTVVLFTRGFDGSGWRWLRIVGPSMRPIIVDVLARGEDWLRPSGARERFETFAVLHDHPDPEVRSLALAELDKTPWRHLRTLDLRLPKDELWASLSKRSELPWVSVRLRLLSIDPRPGDLERLSARLHSIAAVGGTLHLQPLALAFTAAGGAEAIDRIRALYGPGNKRSRAERAAVASALAIHATDGDPKLRSQILTALDEMLESEPALGPLIAHTLDTLGIWSHADRFFNLLAAGAYGSPQDRFAVTAYVMRARAMARRASGASTFAGDNEDTMTNNTFVNAAIASAVAIAALVSPAFAHEAEGVAGGLQSGFLHPLMGWDHVAAMVAVGLLGAVLGPPAIFLLPVVFPLVMAVGGGLGVAGVPLPAVEIGIAASAVVLGVMVAAGRAIPISAAAIVVAFFAIFHGHAHGTELPAAADALAYGIGFVIGTGLLHLAGIAIGLAWRWDVGKVAVRTAGGMIAVAGVAFLTGVA